MKTVDSLPTFRKKKKRRQRLLRGLVYFSPVLALFCLVTAVYIASYNNRAEQRQEDTPDTVIHAGQHEPNESEQDGPENKSLLEREPRRHDLISDALIRDNTLESQTQQALAVNDSNNVSMTEEETETIYEVFLIAEDGYLTAYTGDRTQVYEYTHIPLGDFPLEQQAMLTRGIYMKTLADYYDFLETYSS